MVSKDTALWLLGSAIHSLAVVGIGVIVASHNPQIVRAHDVIDVPLSDNPVASAPVLEACRG